MVGQGGGKEPKGGLALVLSGITSARVGCAIITVFMAWKHYRGIEKKENTNTSCPVV